ncbi:MAG: DMT family transporter [Pyrinomonadaceae bacterium]|nr:DMT family transporter [Pyrinomonadaceae bacterium]
MCFRFALAALVLAAMFSRQIAGAGRNEWRAGASLGLLIGGGFALQAVGQVYTTPSKSAFITGLTTPLVPLVAFVLFRVRPSIENMLGVCLASIGGALILMPRGTTGVNIGDLWTLSCTLLFALHITLMSSYAPRFDVRALTVLQIGVATGVFLAVWLTIRLCVEVLGAEVLPPAVAREAMALGWTWRIVWQLVYLALIGTVTTFLLWTWGQARMSATHAAIIFSLEPVFATLFAIATRGMNEWIGWRAGFGAALILAGIIVSELRWSEQRSNAKR